jgi:hypothetical protein
VKWLYDYGLWVGLTQKILPSLLAKDREIIHTVLSVVYSMRTGKKEKKIFLIYKEIQNGAVAKSYMRKSFLIY